MKKVRIIGRDQPTTDYGILRNGKEYSIGDPLAEFLLRRGLCELINTPKKKVVKKAKK